MPSNESHMTAVQRESYRATSDTIGNTLRDTMPVPQRSLGEDELRRAYHVDDERRIHTFAPHMRRLFDSMSAEDAAKLQRLLDLRPETISWINGKNDKELKNLDSTVEFISSSRTAGKLLVFVGGICATVIGAIFTLAKNGYDIFILFRGGK